MCLGLYRDHRSFVHRMFGVGMLLLAAEAVFSGLSVSAGSSETVIQWQRWRCMCAALLPGCWLVFALSYPRGGPWMPSWGKWKWVLIAIFIVPMVFVTAFHSDFFAGAAVLDPSRGWLIGLGSSGYAFFVCLLIGVIVIIMRMEQTLRASKGRKRWQVKFLIIGIGAIFSARVYTGSQALLFHALHLNLEVVNTAALIVAMPLILVSVFRARFVETDIYFSQTLLYRSVTLLMVGTYFLAVAALTKVVAYLDSSRYLPLRALVVFLAVVALAVGFFSDRLRLWLKQSVSRHFRRPQYDYRKIWMTFTQRTSTLLEKNDYADAVVKMISEMFDALSVTLWLLDEKAGFAQVVGSTALCEAPAGDKKGFLQSARALIELMQHQPAVVDLEGLKEEALKKFVEKHSEFLEMARIRYCMPLAAGNEVIGMMTLGDRARGLPFTFEELEMLKTIADQVAAGLWNFTLSQQNREAKEMQAFQTVSAVFVHDLKNMASKLSLLLHNFPAHHDNPAFRKDALQAISQSLNKLNDMCGRLSLLRNRLELHPVQCDLNEVVMKALADLRDVTKVSLKKTFHPVPKVRMDPEQIGKVVTNLVLNAEEAAGEGGRISVTTGTVDGWAGFAVTDNGCGMSQEFVEKCLFHPFKTTKKQGTGIGLFHSKMIVDAHSGQMEVESQEGSGTTFRVLLPIRGA